MNGLPPVVSLFSGAGGLDLGFEQAGFRIAIAFDSSKAAIASHKRNFPETEAVVGDLAALGPGAVAQMVREWIRPHRRIGVIGGPPCQGFSRANTTAQGQDVRNNLADVYVDIVQELQRTYKIDFVILENVLGIRDRRHAARYERLLRRLGAMEFNLAERQLCALDFGVPQRRHRLLISGVRKGRVVHDSVPVEAKGLLTVRDAIGQIAGEPAFFKHGLTPKDIPVHPNHWTMVPKSPRFSSPSEPAKDGRSFKRLRWHEASPTVAFGHREIHVHPDGARRLSIFEAMLLQGFPAGFVLEGNLSEQVEQVSNAVPPPLARGVALGIRRSLGKRQ